MKLVILVDSNINSFDKMVEMVNDKDIILINTEKCDEANEYRYLLKTIGEFSKSDSEIMLGKFSGRENVIKELGDECPEMILTLSSKKSSRHYASEPVVMFSNLIQMFEKETI